MKDTDKAVKQHMKLFNSITEISGSREPFSDWYEAENEAEARKAWAKDCERYGIPARATVKFVECDLVTLKPLT